MSVWLLGSYSWRSTVKAVAVHRSSWVVEVGSDPHIPPPLVERSERAKERKGNKKRLE